MTLFFNVRGKTVSADDVANYADKANPKAKKERDAAHNGWAVFGYQSGVVAQAEDAARTKLQGWRAMTDEQRADAIKSGLREPKEWSLDDWLRSNKPKRVMKPFAIRSSAEQCLALAEREGWTNLRIEELRTEAA